jgi:hypothetical protein
MLVQEDGRLTLPNAQHLAVQIDTDSKKTYQLIRKSDKPFRSSKRYLHADRLMGPLLANDFTYEFAVKQIVVLAKDGKCWPEDVDACRKMIDYRNSKGITWYQKFAALEYQLPTGLVIKVKVAGLAGHKAGATLVAPLFWATKAMGELPLQFWVYILRDTFCKYEMSEIDIDIVTMRRPAQSREQRLEGIKPERSLEIINSTAVKELSSEQFSEICQMYHQQLEKYLVDTGQGTAGPIGDFDGGVVGGGSGLPF